MKALYIQIFLLCCINLRSKAQDIPITGTWDYYEVIFYLEIECECTDIEYETVLQEIRNLEQNHFDLVLLDTYFEFDEDNNVQGKLSDTNFKGTYTYYNNEVIINLNDMNLKLQLQTFEDNRQLVYKVDKKILDEAKSYYVSDEVGNVEYSFSQLNFVLKNMFDEEYEDFLEMEMDNSN